MESDTNETVYTVDHVRDMLTEQFGIKPSIWLYHVGKMPGPDKLYSGWPFYSQRQIDLCKSYWMRRGRVPKKG